MDPPDLLHKLMEMERALGRQDVLALRNLLIEAEDGVLALEREKEFLARENASLRQRLESARAALPSNPQRNR
jgi:hypothetical protein